MFLCCESFSLRFARTRFIVGCLSNSDGHGKPYHGHQNSDGHESASLDIHCIVLQFSDIASDKSKI